MGKFKNKIYGLLIMMMAAVVFSPIHISAQIGGTGSINGTVTDSTGATIPGATVVAKNITTGVETTRQTTEGGIYVITPLPPGTYSVTRYAGSANGSNAIARATLGWTMP